MEALIHHVPQMTGATEETDLTRFPVPGAS